MKKITKDNWLLVATKAYDYTYSVGVSEFNEDLQIFMFVNRLLKRYRNSGSLNARLTLNHIITLRNLFGGSYAARLLMIYVDDDLLQYLYPFLEFLDILDKTWPEFNSSIKPDPAITEMLEEI